MLITVLLLTEHKYFTFQLNSWIHCTVYKVSEFENLVRTASCQYGTVVLVTFLQLAESSWRFHRTVLLLMELVRLQFCEYTGFYLASKRGHLILLISSQLNRRCGNAAVTRLLYQNSRGWLTEIASYRRVEWLFDQ